MTTLFIVLALSVLAIVGVGIGVFVRVRSRVKPPTDSSARLEDRFPPRSAAAAEDGIARREADVSA